MSVAVSCSFPNMDDPDCAVARTTVRELYSFHFGNDMHFSPDALAAREKFLTPEFAESLKASPAGIDPFTRTADDPPRAFSIGTCRPADGRAEFTVRMLWKSDTRSEQRDLRVVTVKRGEKWLVDSISDER